MDEERPNNTKLGVVLEQREGEEWREFVDRVATDTLYAGMERGYGLSGSAAAIVDVVLRLERDSKDC